VEKIGQNPKIGQVWRPVAPQPYVIQKVDRPRKLPGPWTTTWSKQYLSAGHPVTCSLFWVRCLFDLISMSDLGGKLPLKWKFSKMSFGIHRRDTELRFVTKFGENRWLQSSWKVAWFTKQKKLGLRGTRPSPHFDQNGPIAPKLPWTFSAQLTCPRILNLVRIGCVLSDLFRKDWFSARKKSIQYRRSAYNEETSNPCRTPYADTFMCAPSRPI